VDKNNSCYYLQQEKLKGTETWNCKTFRPSSNSRGKPQPSYKSQAYLEEQLQFYDEEKVCAK